MGAQPTQLRAAPDVEGARVRAIDARPAAARAPSARATAAPPRRIRPPQLRPDYNPDVAAPPGDSVVVFSATDSTLLRE